MNNLAYLTTALRKAQAPMMDGSHHLDYRECSRRLRELHHEMQGTKKHVEVLRSTLQEIVNQTHTTKGNRTLKEYARSVLRDTEETS